MWRLHTEDEGGNLMLGEPYIPRGLALETARAVLEVRCPMACNTAMGCNAHCKYCYGPDVFHKKDWRAVRYATKTPVNAIWKLLNKGSKPDGMFFSFTTDPFYGKSGTMAKEAIELCHVNDIRTASLTKLSEPKLPGNHRHGATVVSIDPMFWKQWEPRTLEPLLRIKQLEVQSRFDGYIWFSDEPIPPPKIFKQNTKSLFEEIKFADFIIAGKWNYNIESSTDIYKNYLYGYILEFRDFCKSYGIRWHVKSETLKFIGLFHDTNFVGHGGFEKGLIL